MSRWLFVMRDGAMECAQMLVSFNNQNEYAVVSAVGEKDRSRVEVPIVF